MSGSPHHFQQDLWWSVRLGESGRPYLSLHVVSVTVSDQPEALRFYTERLGFPLVADHPLPSGDRWAVVMPPDGAGLLALVKHAADNEDSRFGRNTGVVLMTDNVAALFEKWSARGVPFPQPPVETPWGGRLATFADLDGNRFSLIEFDATTRALETQRRTAAAKQEAEQRAARELEIARDVQARLFAQQPPALETITCAGTCVQARTVGGDYYDFLEPGDGRLGMVVADVAGKGISAALLMANLQANLRSQYAAMADGLDRVLGRVNRLFYGSTEDARYATLFFGEYQDRQLRYANCGHPAPLLLRRSGAVEWLAPTGHPVGMFREADFPTAVTEFQAGDTLVICTDGVIEAVNEAGEEFGARRLVDLVGSRRGLPAADLLETIMAQVREFSANEQIDDITLVVARGA